MSGLFLLLARAASAALIAAAVTTMFFAIRAEAASIILPSSDAAPLPCASASLSASRMRSARSTSSAGGVKTSLASSICEGWIAHLPSMPSARRGARRPVALRILEVAERAVDRAQAVCAARHDHARERECHWSPG